MPTSIWPARQMKVLNCVNGSLNCCNDSDVGNWIDKRGRAVHQGADEVTCLYVTRGQEVVNLQRRQDCGDVIYLR